ncbi:RHS repeat-associated core domain-containing protein [Streptomyces sp. NPDC048282]|uniref:RHS repeat-associated core domain-containing protein n=1 Tax=Streptomyces sp. NPDC048282 TaxID=3365528 RepID=UPI003717D53E
MTVQLPLDTSQALVALAYDEYGISQTDNTARYGWLGGKERSSDTVTGAVLMGVRLYDPSTGRFLSADPVPGGSANAYDYCNGDPVNRYDLDGNFAIPIIAGEIALIILWVTSWICGYYGCSISLPHAPSIPLPNHNSKSAKKHKNTKYIGYMIYYKGKIWKYGISRVGKSRPASQISSCNRHYKVSSGCKYTVLRSNMKGWIRARSWEAGMMAIYVARHGHCPPGAPKCI